MGNNNRIESCREVQYCKNLLSDIMRDPNLKAFLEPVDWEGLNIPSYPDIIKRPMDLMTVRSKLEKGFYKSFLEVDLDVNLIWSNAMTFNRDGSEYFMAAKEMCNLWKSKTNNIPAKEFNNYIPDAVKRSQGKTSDNSELSPPNLMSPRIKDQKSISSSGSASWSNVVRFVEAQNK